mmetsp:Transcript_6810/g.15546  ORF Transcript_6810/g.15546 Transcript_6810/m.15546 type:complete len:242 (-) Transcript_6810:683-1408(-)
MTRSQFQTGAGASSRRGASKLIALQFQIGGERPCSMFGRVRSNVVRLLVCALEDVIGEAADSDRTAGSTPATFAFAFAAAAEPLLLLIALLAALTSRSQSRSRSKRFEGSGADEARVRKCQSLNLPPIQGPIIKSDARRASLEKKARWSHLTLAPVALLPLAIPAGDCGLRLMRKAPRGSGILEETVSLQMAINIEVRNTCCATRKDHNMRSSIQKRGPISFQSGPCRAARGEFSISHTPI